MTIAESMKFQKPEDTSGEYRISTRQTQIKHISFKASSKTKQRKAFNTESIYFPVSFPAHKEALDNHFKRKL